MCPNYCSLPSGEIEGPVYALFIKNWELINTLCLVDCHTQHANLAHNLDG